MFDDNNHPTISFVAQIDTSGKSLENECSGKMGILALRDTLFMPGTINPVTIGRFTSKKLIKKAERTGTIIGVFGQKDANVEYPDASDLFPYGVAAKVMHTVKLPDGNYSALLQCMNRIRLVEFDTESRFTEPQGRVEAAIEEHVEKENKTEYDTCIEMIREKAFELMHILGLPHEEMMRFAKESPNTSLTVNTIINTLPTDSKTRHELLAVNSDYLRAIDTLRLLNTMLQMTKLKLDIENKTHADIDKQQREYFLNQQIRNIQAELGHSDDNTNKVNDIDKMREEARKKQWSKQIGETFEQEVGRLSRINPQNPDYNVQLNYLNTLLQLPWDFCTKDQLDLTKAEKILNKDHYGMEKVKERILEHLAVLKLRADQKSPIICLYGPPGVGKTSLGKSIAAALKRKYVRISLGGLHDESEIRGHRKTYIGAMPGRIIKSLIRAGSSNPVFILDEIDKVLSQASVNGDPSSALLEVLDPEQNVAFHDNFLDLDYDLSRVMFIATANDVQAIPAPLRDRMELIEVGGYLTEEKIEIAKRHLVPKAKENNGMNDQKSLKLNKESLEYLIEHYTRESGVRALEKQINKIFRKKALFLARSSETECKFGGPEEIIQLLGKPIFNRDKYQGNSFAGVVTGLAWTSVGGEILFIETSISKGKGGKLTLTGNLGDVMKESAMLAMEYIKAHAEKLQIDTRIFDNYNIHIHVPEGAVPKDGPSAGITMATSIASALTQRKVRNNLAMTGEITLRGKVLPVGGIKEKILAAKRAGITDLMLCKENQKDIEEIPELYIKGLTFHYVDTIQDVWDFALLEEKVENPVEFVFEEEKKEGQ